MYKSYYTSKLLTSNHNCINTILYGNSDDIYELTVNIKLRSNEIEYIIVCCEHNKIPKIIKHLLNLKHLPDITIFD